VIDPNGDTRPDASPELQQLTAAIAKAELESRKKIDQVFRQTREKGWAADGGLTIRDGRLCIPLLAENKRKLRGFIHDESSSGQTVYIEPEEVFSLNNKVRDLEFDRRREVVRILVELTAELRPAVPAIESYHGLLTRLDFVRAKALLAVELEASMPELLNDQSVELINARHPLLFLNMKRHRQTVVPLNVRINEQSRVILVSGPNAGGKSVCMKTVGLLQLMVQAGLLIPASEHSKVGIFRQVFADIGDDQSIESDLSTYSAHLTKMRHFSKYADSKTLVLIDEFGTGTDPQFGGPIAEAVLETLNNRKIRGVITTHYSNLKLFAGSAEGIENASMLFDQAGMRPTYILETGKPGSSYAFEIARKIGLPEEVISLAKSKISEDQKRVESLLTNLERDKRKILESGAELEKRERRVKQLIEENEKLKVYLEENRKVILKDAKLEAQNIIKNANKLIENTISEIKGAKAEKEKTRSLRGNLERELKKHDVKEVKSPPAAANEEITKGDWIRVTDSGAVGQVLDVHKDNVVMALGELRSVVKKNRVEKIPNRDVPKSVKRSTSVLSENIARFKPEIDVRGMRGEEALYEIEKVLDRALMAGFPSLKIIHGRGDGILRKLIREYLRKYSQVKRMEDEHADRGGDGITYVYLE
jgi:DNA mismatch repair protein MutS2